MTSGSFRFGDYVLDPVDRSLARDGRPVGVSARYLDALVLLVSDADQLVSKDRFMQEVWRGVPVTDEALTQCVRTLRRLLDDDAARPRYIETVPKHGYRFIAAVQRIPVGTPQSDVLASLGMNMPATGAPTDDDLPRWRGPLLAVGAGTLGASLAGVAGGLIYGFALASRSGGVAGGGSVLFVIRSPGNVTGALEGLALGASVGLGAWLAELGPLRRSLRLQFLAAGVAGALGGLGITVAGGRLLGGSLQLLSHSFPGSTLRLDALGALFGEVGFDRVTQAITAMGEGALFAIGIVGIMQLSVGVRQAS